MKRNIIEIGTTFTVDVDKIAAVDWLGEDGDSERRSVRFFFQGVSSGYSLKFPSEELAQKIYREIIERMKQE